MTTQRIHLIIQRAEGNITRDLPELGLHVHTAAYVLSGVPRPRRFNPRTRPRLSANHADQVPIFSEGTYAWRSTLHALARPGSHAAVAQGSPPGRLQGPRTQTRGPRPPSILIPRFLLFRGTPRTRRPRSRPCLSCIIDNGFAPSPSVQSSRVVVNSVCIRKSNVHSRGIGPGAGSET